MAKLPAEQFLNDVIRLAKDSGIELDSVEFTMDTGMRCSWYNPKEDQEEGMEWMLTPQGVQQ